MLGDGSWALTAEDVAAIDAMGKAFAKLRAAGAKALWRFAYDRAMPGEHYYTAETILGHIAQLRAPFSKQYDALYVLQAGFMRPCPTWAQLRDYARFRRSFEVLPSKC